MKKWLLFFVPFILTFAFAKPGSFSKETEESIKSLVGLLSGKNLTTAKLTDVAFLDFISDKYSPNSSDSYDAIYYDFENVLSKRDNRLDCFDVPFTSDFLAEKIIDSLFSLRYLSRRNQGKEWFVKGANISNPRLVTQEWANLAITHSGVFSSRSGNRIGVIYLVYPTRIAMRATNAHQVCITDLN